MSVPTRASELLPWCKDMRATAPVWRNPDDGTWHVFRHADIGNILADHTTFSSDIARILQPHDGDLHGGKGDLTTTDPPRHRQLRSLVNKAFTPRVVEDLAPRIRELTNELLGGVEGNIELVTDLAYPLPVIVIAELLGIPTEDRDFFKRWADGVMAHSSEMMGGGESFAPARSENTTVDAIGPDLATMSEYLAEKAQSRRTAPADDLLSRLVAAEIDGEKLTNQEVASTAGLLLLAGHITTTALLSNAVLCLNENPDTAAELWGRPDAIPAAIEEVLRYRAPFTRALRVTTTDTTIGAIDIAKDQLVTLWLVSANHDEEQFPDPHRFDINRPRNPHVSFGQGVHFCLGAPLARLEAKIALGILLDRLPHLKILGEPERYNGVELNYIHRMVLADTR